VVTVPAAVIKATLDPLSDNSIMWTWSTVRTGWDIRFRNSIGKGPSFPSNALSSVFLKDAMAIISLRAEKCLRVTQTKQPLSQMTEKRQRGQAAFSRYSFERQEF
jgi:hypothetical protein